MVNFEEMAMLFTINNIEERENNNIFNKRQTRNRDIITDTFTLSNFFFIKKFRLTKAIVKNVIDLLRRPQIVSNCSRSSAIDFNIKV